MDNSKKLITWFDVLLICLGLWWLLILAAPLKADSKVIDQSDNDDILIDEEREKFYEEAENDIKELFN